MEKNAKKVNAGIKYVNSGIDNLITQVSKANTIEQRIYTKILDFEHIYVLSSL